MESIPSNIEFEKPEHRSRLMESSSVTPAKYDLIRSKDQIFLNPALLYIHIFLAYLFSGQQLQQVAQPPDGSSTSMDAKLEALDPKLESVRQHG
ncbi:uncharacterized protein G2W53_032946 [Senna tora]|uniref:Uncharacterized protein n=1 Tax=Senna tora TaxID=362788 RepID=A0A834W6P8_9FABA|nr:uncharacterized protein G2W53_032946 [Senna tora]